MAMAAPAPTYESIWIGRDEAIALLDARGFDRAAAVRWLNDAASDRGSWPPANRANPARDLFRWSPTFTDRDNDAIGIRWAFIRGETTMEVSRALLVGLLRQQKRVAKKKKAGRKGHDWKAVEKRVFKLMDHNDDFSADDPDWNSPARLVEQLEETTGIARPTLYAHIWPMIEKWRLLRAKNSRN
jgi:hypothetical protein